jgi:GNAT superfamily N-acetyltransferase
MRNEGADMVIRKMTRADIPEVFDMMRVFYDSPALIHKSSDAVLRRDIEDCLSDMPFVEAYVFEEGGAVSGYSMVSKNYTTEYGGLCIWIEDLYFKETHRNKGNATQFFSYIEKQYPDAVRFKLEVEQENENAVAAYKKNGYAVSDYFLMTKEMDKDE